MRYRLAIRYAVEGDLRFISHHDTLRLFERALARAQIPARFSQGFNPRPRISVVLPRPVGVASSDELLLVELTHAETPSSVLTRLSQQVPVGMTLLSADVPADDDRRLPCRARYGLDIEPDVSAALEARASAFLAEDRFLLQRSSPKSKREKVIDIRPYVQTIEVTPSRLSWTQTITHTGTARLGEVLEALGLSARDCLHRLRRLEVWYRE